MLRRVGGSLSWANVVGAVAAAALVAGVFRPWVGVPPEVASHALSLVGERLGDPTRPPVTNAEEWRALWEDVVFQGHVTGLDVFHWARLAAPRDPALLGEGAEAREAVQGRAILLAAGLVAAVPVAAGLLALVAVLRRFRPLPAWALVLAMLTGLAAVLLPAAFEVVRGALPAGLERREGLTLWLVAGAGLFLAGSFGAPARTWWAPLLVALLLAAVLGAVATAWVRA
jgi:hypothetical protein